MDRDLFLESALACRAGGDSVECYTCRTRATALSFDGRATGTPCRSDSEEFAVRVYRQGRLGVAGSSSGSIADWSDLVGRAEANARHGAPVGAFSFVSRKSAGKCATPLAPAELVEGLQELRSRLVAFDPSTHWSAELAARSRSWRVVTSDGGDCASSSTLVSISLRARRTSGGLPLDYVMRVDSPTLGGGIASTLARVELELPVGVPSQTRGPDRPVILGPSAVARASAMLRGLQHALDQSVTVFDAAGTHDGTCDDEGAAVPAHVPIVSAGRPAPAWTCLGASARQIPTGRAFRASIGRPPKLRHLGLRWGPAGGALPGEAVFVPKLSAWSRSSADWLVGHAADALLWRDGRVVARLPRGSFRMPVHDLLGGRLLGVSNERFAVGPHAMPLVAARAELVP